MYIEFGLFKGCAVHVLLRLGGPVSSYFQSIEPYEKQRFVEALTETLSFAIMQAWHVNVG
jgi:hypothetical protein